jgi:hypothetical protein
VALKSYWDFKKIIFPLLKSLKPQNRVIGVLLANLRITSGLPVIRPVPMPSVEITSYKRTSHYQTDSQAQNKVCGIPLGRAPSREPAGLADACEACGCIT